MVRKIANWFLNAISLYLVSLAVPGVRLADFSSALIAIVVISLLNVFIKPILLVLTLPITILTLGLFTFIINAFLFLLAGVFTPGFHVDGLGSAIIGSILFTIITMVFRRLVESH